MAEYSKNSPYSKTQMYGDYLDILTPRTVIHDQTDESYTIEEKYNQRPDMLAYARFGSAKLWWVFSMRNKDQLVDPIQDFRAGVTIRIPKIENVR